MHFNANQVSLNLFQNWKLSVGLKSEEWVCDVLKLHPLYKQYSSLSQPTAFVIYASKGTCGLFKVRNS